MRYTLLVYCFLAFVPCRARNIDSLKKVLLTAKAETKASTLRELGKSYLKSNQPDSAVQYLNSALAFATRYNDIPTAVAAFSALGFIAEANKDYTNAIDYYRRAYDISDSVRIAKKVNDNTAEMYSNNFMMDVMGSIKQSAQTTEQILKTIANKKALNDTLALSINYFNLALLYKSMQMYDKALNAFKTSFEYAGHINYAEMQLSAVNQIADLYEFNGNYTEALDYIKKRAEINALLNSPRAKTAVELQAGMDKREAELLHQKLETTKRSYWIAGISTLAVLLLVIGFIYYKQTQLRQRNIAMQAIIATEESERQRIARDLHDSVSQTMSAAKINLNIIGGEIPFKDEEQRSRFYKVVGMVDDGFKEVRTISHNMMPWALHKAGLAKVISQFIGNVENGTISFNFFSTGFDEPFNDQLELILYRVLQESVNNVIKHAGANRVDIALIKDENSISLTIEDNGKGFDASHPDFKAGMGLGNLRSRINFLKGKVEVDSQPGRGALVSVYIPLTAL